MSQTLLLPETATRIDELTATAQHTGRVPALLLGVVRGGSVVHLATAGEVPPVPADTQYRIGSISKTMTAALVMALRDEGHLALDDLLYRHLPGTPVGGVTLRQLLGHVGGLQREPDGPWWERNEGLDLDRFLAELTPDQLPYPPYRGYHYSNLAYGLLGAVVSRVTGERWSSMVGKYLLEPLGMTRTSYLPVEPFARGYVVHPWHATLREEPRTDTGAMAPAGQLWSTIADLARWAHFLASPDPTVLSPASVAAMGTPVVMSDLEAWTAGHGLGLQLWRRGERLYVGHAGSMPGYQAMLAVHRPSGTGVVAFANAYTMHGTSLSTLSLNALTDILDREPAPTVAAGPPATWRPTTGPAPADIEPLTGRWWWMGREYALSWDAGDLVVVPLTVPEPSPWRFVADGTDRWRGTSGSNDGELLRIQRGPGGTVVALEIATCVFTREP
jgi:CubicO group peptidase (beta-lactamase class C family)